MYITDMCSGDGVFPQYVNTYQTVTFVVCPEVSQVEQPTARVHTASINSTEEYQVRISGRVTGQHRFYKDGRSVRPVFFISADKSGH